MIEFFKALLSKDDVMIGLALGSLASVFFYWAWPSAYPKHWEGDK